MIDVAYLVFLIALVWTVVRRRRPWICRVRSAGQQGLRLIAMVLAIAIGSLGCLVIAIQSPGHPGIYRWLGYAVGSAMLVGALLYTIGLGIWLDRTAFALRLSGWVLVAAALVVPSTLTLALPVVAAMIVTVANIPSGRSTLESHRMAARGAIPASAVETPTPRPVIETVSERSGATART